MSAVLSAFEQRVVGLIEDRGPSLPTQLAEHVAIPTGYNHTRGLDEYRGILTDRLRGLGAEIELREGVARPEWIGTSGWVDENPPPTAICTRKTEDAPRVLIAGHLDTVFDPAGKFLTMSTSADCKTANGPGVVDMKGGILIAITALEALAEAGVDIPWTFTLNSDEETGTYCSAHILAEVAKRHEFGLALEPALPGGELAVERKGSGQFKVEAFGKSAHAGRAFFEGVSAVYGLAHAMVALEGMSSEADGVTVNVGPLKGGEATNAVPEYAMALGNARFPTPELGEALGARLDALATASGAIPGIAVHRAFSRPAKPLTPEVEALALRARGCAERLGQRLPFASTGGVCDGNNLQAAGLPTIDTLGVRGGDLHRTSEWIELASLVERSQLFALLLMDLHGLSE